MLVPEFSESEWKWAPEAVENSSDEARARELAARYHSYMNEETKAAGEKVRRSTDGYLKTLSGTVLDVATGMGGMLGQLLQVSGDIVPIASDVDPNILRATRARLGSKVPRKFHAVAADAKRLPFREASLDNIVTASGLGNIPDSPKFLLQAHRCLRPGGRLLLTGGFVDEGTKSARLAEEYGYQQGMVEGLFRKALVEAGFTKIDVKIIASAVWAENPMDLMPAAGDVQHFYLAEIWR